MENKISCANCIHSTFYGGNAQACKDCHSVYGFNNFKHREKWVRDCYDLLMASNWHARHGTNAERWACAVNMAKPVLDARK